MIKNQSNRHKNGYKFGFYTFHHFTGIIAQTNMLLNDNLVYIALELEINITVNEWLGRFKKNNCPIICHEILLLMSLHLHTTDILECVSLLNGAVILVQREISHRMNKFHSNIFRKT